MRNMFLLFLMLALLFSFGCIASAENSGAMIDLRESDLFTQDEMAMAVDVILEEFSKWEGCEMHLITYAGDDVSQHEMESVKKLDPDVYDECAVFYSAFRSPKEAYGAWQADEEYTYSWTLARKDKGGWVLQNFGWAENYLESQQYTEEDMTAALNAISAEVDRMEGVKMRFIRYRGDEYSKGELEYVNSLERGVFDECAVFEVWFISPKEAYGAWEPDMLYTWSFYLARAEKGEWNIVTYGY